jgi:hypothetical protein
MEYQGYEQLSRSGSVEQTSPGASFAFPVKVTALVCFAAIVGACILVFLYKTCIADCITQYRLTDYGCHTSAGFGGALPVTSAQASAVTSTPGCVPCAPQVQASVDPPSVSRVS